MATRVEAQQLLIAMRRKKLAEMMVCSRCGQSIGPMPNGSEHDEFYIKNREFWLDVAAYRHAPKCHCCQVLAARARGHKRRRMVDATGEHFTDQDVVALFDKQEGRCVYCSFDLLMSKYHIDHIKALANGGGNGSDNIQLTCPSCNHSKGTKSHEEFLAYRLTSKKLACIKPLP